MKRSALLTVAASLLVACALQAQTTNPLIAEGKRSYTMYKGYWTRAAAAMPEDGYSFKPSAPVPAGAQDMRTFGELLAHVADHQTSWCSSVLGPRKTGDAAS